MVAKIYAIESPVLEMGSNLKNKLSAVRVKDFFFSQTNLFNITLSKYLHRYKAKYKALYSCKIIWN